MTESTFTSFDALYAHIFKLYEDGNYAEGLAAAVQGKEQFPEFASTCCHLGASLAARLGDSDQALTLLEEMLAGDFWLPARAWEDSDFDSIRGLPAFERLRGLSMERLAAAQANARPELLTVLPTEDAEPGALPLLLALHGNNSSVRWHKDHWRVAAGDGWLVGMPQSSQAAGPDSEGAPTFIWDDVPWARREILGHHAALTRAYRIDEQRMVLGGFSRGAEMAIHLAVTGAVAVRGFVAVCPGGPLTMQPEQWDPIIAEGKGRDLRGTIIMGGQDRFVPGTERLVTLLREAGITCKFDVHPDMGHDYPVDFKAQLGSLLAFALGEKPA